MRDFFDCVHTERNFSPLHIRIIYGGGFSGCSSYDTPTYLIVGNARYSFYEVATFIIVDDKIKSLTIEKKTKIYPQVNR